MPKMLYYKLFAENVLLTTEEIQIIEGLQESLRSSQHTNSIPPHMGLHLSKLTSNDAQESKLSFENTMELYKIMYGRIIEFTGTALDISQLSTSDRKTLLSHNLESICIIRMASNLHPQFDHNLDFQPLKLFFGPCPLKIEQIFDVPWAVDPDHVNLYCKTVNEIINLPIFDEKINALFQIIVFLDTKGVDGSQFENFSKVQKMQEDFVTLLLKYLKSKVGPLEALTKLNKCLNFLHVLRILSNTILRRK